MTNDNDPLAGVPAVDHSVHLRRWSAGVSGRPGAFAKRCDCDSCLKVEHIAWERQQRAAAEADAKSALAMTEIAVSRSTELMRELETANLRLRALEADAAAMRAAIELALGEYWLRRNLFYRSGFDELPTTLGVEALQSSLSGSAGAALLAECDALRARVERLRGVANAAKRVYVLDDIPAVRWQQLHEALAALKPGDWEEADNA